MSGSFAFPVQSPRSTRTASLASGADGDKDAAAKPKPFRCGDCEEDFSAICLLHTHLRGGSYHYDQETMTAFPLSGTSCSSVLRKMKMKWKRKTPKITPVSAKKLKAENTTKRKIFKIKKIKKTKSKTGTDDDPDDFEQSFNINPDTGAIEPVDADRQEVEIGDGGKDKKQQLVINLYGMDKNEDGSLRLVVGEKDSEVFKTPVGDAILKALKNKGEVFKGHMKVIYNYPEIEHSPDDETTPNAEETTPNLEDDGDDDIDEDDVEANKSGDITIEDAEPERKHFTRSAKKTPKATKASTPAKKRKVADTADSITIEPLSPESGASPEKAVIDSSKEESENKSGKSMVFKHLEKRIDTFEAIEILNEVLSGHHLEKVAREAIPKPRGGEVYLIDLDGLPKTKERKVDLFKWNNCGSKRIPKGKEVVMKTCYKVKLPNGYFSDVFVKHFYQMIENPRYCLLHYIGDPPVL